MDKTGYFFPFFIISCMTVCYIFGLIDKMLAPKGNYEKWLEEELERNPDYINWLKTASRGKDYKLGLRVLKKINKRR